MLSVEKIRIREMCIHPSDGVHVIDGDDEIIICSSICAGIAFGVYRVLNYVDAGTGLGYAIWEKVGYTALVLFVAMSSSRF